MPFQALCNLDGNIPGLMGHIRGNIPVFFLKCDHLPYFIGYSWGSKSYWCVRAKRRVAGWVGNGVAGMIKMIVSQWIIPENSLRKTHK